MKKIIAFVLFLVALSGESRAQFTKGSWEMTLTAGINSFAESENGTSRNDQPTFLGINVSPGYYIIDGLSFEPDFGVMADLSGNADFDTYYKIVGNLSYTFKLQEKPFAPYVKAGYGISNGIEYALSGFQGTFAEASKDRTVSILNTGAGMKWLVSDKAAIRTELNYHVQSLTEDSYDYKFSSVGLLVGVSLIL
jgi:hypothetical protein